MKLPGNRKQALALGLALGLAGCGSGDTLAPGQERPEANEARSTEQIIASIGEISRQQAKKGLVRRVNQAKSLGCFEAVLEVPVELPLELRQGLFAKPGRHPATVRFANASSDDDTEKDFRGLSISVREVDGEPLWGERGRQDFLLNSYPALFAANPDEFQAFLAATANGSRWRFFANPFNWDSVAILLKGRERIDSPFNIRYWSTTPYRFGDDETVAVKYQVVPCSQPRGETAVQASPDFLRDTMQAQLAAAEVCFDFKVQFQGDPETMPIEDASVIWDEQLAPFQKVARLRIAQQPFSSGQAVAACEALAFNPWQSLEAHRPLGGINRVRRPIYAEAAALRRQLNDGRGGQGSRR